MEINFGLGHSLLQFLSAKGAVFVLNDVVHKEKVTQIKRVNEGIPAAIFSKVSGLVEPRKEKGTVKETDAVFAQGSGEMSGGKVLESLVIDPRVIKRLEKKMEVVSIGAQSKRSLDEGFGCQEILKEFKRRRLAHPKVSGPLNQVTKIIPLDRAVSEKYEGGTFASSKTPLQPDKSVSDMDIGVVKKNDVVLMDKKEELKGINTVVKLKKKTGALPEKRGIKENLCGEVKGTPVKDSVVDVPPRRTILTPAVGRTSSEGRKTTREINLPQKEFSCSIPLDKKRIPLKLSDGRVRSPFMDYSAKVSERPVQEKKKETQEKGTWTLFKIATENAYTDTWDLEPPRFGRSVAQFRAHVMEVQDFLYDQMMCPALEDLIFQFPCIDVSIISALRESADRHLKKKENVKCAGDNPLFSLGDGELLGALDSILL